MLDAYACANHGWLSHITTHEAGHAAAAILLDFEFRDVTIRPAHETVVAWAGGASSVIAGGVTMLTDRPAEWVQPRQADALVFLLAGSTAENALLDHHLDKSFKGDIEMYLRGIERPDGLEREEARLLISAGRRDTEVLLAANMDAVTRVRDLMVSRVPKDSSGHFIDFEQPISLTYDEVRLAVLNAESADLHDVPSAKPSDTAG